MRGARKARALAALCGKDVAKPVYEKLDEGFAVGGPVVFVVKTGDLRAGDGGVNLGRAHAEALGSNRATTGLTWSVQGDSVEAKQLVTTKTWTQMSR
jgi:hypothetical protein